MIKIINTENTKSRTFGWVQNPGDFRKLCDVVAVFDFDSAKHKQIVAKTIPALVLPADGQSELLAALNSRPLKIKYSDLKGTAFTPRSSARCNGIIQAAVKAQGSREFVDDWSADGFVRWSQCLGFIAYDYSTDAFSITNLGLRLSEAKSEGKELNEAEKNVLIEAVLSYPPAVRVLSLLSEDNAHLTKFEIGKQLGFTSESGFTSMPQDILIRALSDSEDNKEKNKMRTDWEGSSDKYARMISGWLAKLGLVKQIAKEVTVRVGSSSFVENIGQSYVITAQGITALRRSQGASKHNRIAKNISFEMLSTKGSDRTFLRTRRALVIKALSESKTALTEGELLSFLSSYEVETSTAAIADDVVGLKNIGLDIKIVDDSFVWQDKINDFVIPISSNIVASTHEQIKDELRKNISHIPHEYLSLVDLAYDSKQNRLFEMKTMQLLTEECGFNGLHLGGTRKPDGVAYTTEITDSYGIIIDTKAYSRGYNLPIAQADQMGRYIQENQRRDVEENSNEWWNSFGDGISIFYFMFVAGHFVGEYQEQINRISLITGTKGAAIDINRLLVTADDLKGGKYDLTNVAYDYFG